MASHPTFILRCILLYSLALVCSCFSFDASLHSLKKIATRQRRTFFDVASSPLWGTAAGESTVATDTILPTEDQNPTKTQIDLHPPAIDAIAKGLLVRAQNVPNMPLRIFEDEADNIEPWQVTLSAGNVAQQSVEEWRKKEKLTLEENEEDLQVVAGRVVAVLTRLEELEEELLKRCNTMSEELILNMGVPSEELKTFQTTAEGATVKKMRDLAAAIDAACLFDEQLRYNRAKSLFAMFLHEIEGPGLRRNGVTLPCMDVDFLQEDIFSALLGSANVEKSVENNIEKSVDEKGDNIETRVEEKALPSQSLHPVTIDAIEEAFRLRAQNMTTSPLRLLDSNMEWFEVQYSIMKFAERFLEKYTKGNKNNEEPIWTEEELQTIGGRIVGVLVRLDDLEWEWNHRVSTSTLGQPESSEMIPYNQWKSILGLHPDNVEQRCIKTVDMALLEENDFARVRAERMLALFLLNIEGPAMKASGNLSPDGSEVDFIQDYTQLKLMMPKQVT
ncbi:hypothetical protein ACHAWT_008329 [Skeletonema menzelii]